MGRQIGLIQGSETLSLTDSTYVLQAKDGWQSTTDAVIIRLLVEPGTMAERDRLVGAIRQMLHAATAYELRAAGDPVWIRTKTCDDLPNTAELGATWTRRKVRGGQVAVQPLSGTAAAPAAVLVVRVDVTPEPWQRQTPEPVLEVISGPTYIAPYSSGAIRVTGDMELYARRLGWTSATGLSVRTFWQYASAGAGQINFLQLSTNFRVYWGGAAGRWYFADETGSTLASSDAQTYTAGDMLEVLITLTGSDCTVFVNGKRLIDYTSETTLSYPATPDTYRVLMTSSAGTQVFWSIQVWAVAISDADAADLANWGRPHSELCYLVPPSDLKATNAIYKLYNAAGDVAGPVRLLLDSSGGQDFGKVRVGYRPRRIPSRSRTECESGSLGDNTASNANAAASGGSQARFTPADTAWATRVTVSFVDDPGSLAASQGEYRLFLAGYDSAASVQVNQVRWRLLVAGVAGDWSDALSFAAVSERALLDLGTVSIPPGNWPQEAIDASTTVYGSTFIDLELQAANSTGSGGGTLDMDALYLVPAEAEGTVEATFDVSAVYLLLDFATDPFAAILVSDVRSYEFAGWGVYLGDEILLTPIYGTCGTFFFMWYRDAVEEFYPNDTCDVWFRYAPRFLQ